MKETRKKYDMLTDNPGKSLLFFVLPMILGNLFQQFYNITDSVVVGKFVGEQALAAVGASYAITNVFIAIAIGGGIGSSVVISQFLGAGKLAKMKTAVYTTMFNFLGIAAFLAAVGLLFNNRILNLVNVPEDIFSDPTRRCIWRSTLSDCRSCSCITFRHRSSTHWEIQRSRCTF